ncbi:MAG: competence type IV pilus minor pilin ComGD [Streptococcus sp.]|nr:competence type IV pilus minor pilin ComGD [Streptococcus sp.]
MKKIEMRLNLLQIKAFTLLESLLVLFVTSFVIFTLSGTINKTFEQVREQLFFLEFEHLYQESQKISVAKHERIDLVILDKEISNGYRKLHFSPTIQAHEKQVIQFDKAGGNSSLSKVIFQTQEGEVVYQLYIGNGKFKKTTGKS